MLRRLIHQLHKVAGLVRYAHWTIVVLSLASLFASVSRAQSVIHVSPDIDLALGTPERLVRPADVSFELPSFPIGRVDLGPLPEVGEVTGFGLDGTDRLFSIQSVLNLGAGVIARPMDVVRYDGASYSIAFDGRANGLGDGVTIDAVSRAGKDLRLSFDTTVLLPGGLVATDHDVVSFNSGVFSIEVLGAVAGIHPFLDIDGIHHVAGSRYLFSFDTAGRIAGISFEDEDILEFNGAVWALAWDGSAQDAAWEESDVDAILLPEPSLVLLLALGVLTLARLRQFGEWVSGMR